MRPRRNRLARFVCTEDITLQPVQLPITFNRVSAVAALLNPIDTIHLLPDPRSLIA